MTRCSQVISSIINICEHNANKFEIYSLDMIRRDKMSTKATNIDLTAATDSAMRVRRLYQQLEKNSLGRVWTIQEDMLALATDVGVLGRMVMAAEGSWGYDGDEQAELKKKLPECLWWILVLSDRLGVDVTDAFTTFIDKLDTELKMNEE